MLSTKQLKSIELVGFDFDGVFTDNTVYIDENGKETVRCWRSDGLGLARLKDIGIKTYIISTEKNPLVARRAQKLKVPCLHDVKNKRDAIERVCSELEVAPNKVMFVGNDINDIPAFKIVGMPVGVGDADPCIDSFVTHKLSKSGGYGAVREICDLIYEANIS